MSSDPKLLGRARARAHGLTLWAAFNANELPDLVRQFVEQDLPWLMEAAGTLDIDSVLGTTPTNRILEALAVHHRLRDLVRLVRLADEQIDGSQVLWKARESDVTEGFDRMCRHRQRALLEIAVRELAGTGWTGDELAGDEEETVR